MDVLCAFSAQPLDAVAVLSGAQVFQLNLPYPVDALAIFSFPFARGPDGLPVRERSDSLPGAGAGSLDSSRRSSLSSVVSDASFAGRHARGNAQSQRLSRIERASWKNPIVFFKENAFSTGITG